MLYGDFKKIDYTYVDAGPAKCRARIDVAAGPSQIAALPPLF